MALTAQTLPADPLTSADREALLDNLEKLRDAAEGKMDSRIRAALSAFRSASNNEDAALELYLNCVERVNFEDQNMKAADFREWKRKEAEKLAEPSLKPALRLQVSWLVLALETIPENSNRKKIAAEAQVIVDGMFSNPDKLKGQGEVLSQSVMSTVFARAYEVNHFKVSDFPLSPLPVGEVYDKLVLPALRSPSTLAGLQSAWMKRIQQETIMVEGFSGGRGSNVGRKGVPVSATVSPEFEKFIEDTKPRLQWKMELDLFQCGDESGAAVRMLAHLQNNITHPAAKEWSEELQELLTPVGAAPAEAEDTLAP
ncbi:MAG: hypothetical protein V4640_02640 [Verrucomicrobiota bacterium]